MRARLLTNRDGRLTPSQWRDMVTEPLVTLLLLLVPGMMVVGPRLFFGAGWIIGLGGLGALAVVLLLRAQRYARLPVHYAVLSAGDEFRPFWMFWKAQTFYTESEKPLHFHKSLAPYMPLRSGERYLVYYLKDAETNVLLSIAPADHEDAAQWQPSSLYEARLKRRTRAG
jgi:hypothetical protein